MAKCLNGCGKEAAGRSKYCSDSCKVLYNRKQKSVNTETVTPAVKAVEKLLAPGDKLTPKAVECINHPVHTLHTEFNRGDGVDKIPNFGQSDCECKHCQQGRVNKSKNIINHGPHKTVDQLMRNEVNRISLPGDVDYEQPVRQDARQAVQQAAGLEMRG